MKNNYLTFAWWNTSLSPAARSRGDSNAIDLVCSLIQLMTEQLDIDFLALGETSEVDVAEFRKKIDTNSFEIISQFTTIGRTKFDTSFLYRKKKLTSLDVNDISIVKGQRNFKIAQRVNLISKFSDSPLYIFISHWSSRLFEYEDSAIRDLFGMSLRGEIDEILRENELAHIILLGDYNDEPFNKSLSDHLMASRDRNLAKHRPHLFYNPFWRLLGSDYQETTANGIKAGTYFHEQGQITQWRTFDQILFSSAFLGEGEFSLKDSLTQILDIPEYMSLVIDRESIFDHLPIISIIEKE